MVELKAMAAAYSVDLRIKVLNFIDQGGKKLKLASCLGLVKIRFSDG
jgi:hypothetical protein